MQINRVMVLPLIFIVFSGCVKTKYRTQLQDVPANPSEQNNTHQDNSRPQTTDPAASSASSPQGGAQPLSLVSPTPSPSPTPSSSPSALPLVHSWTLKYKSQCNGVNSENCRGGYGFTLSSDGKFAVGPAPEGQNIKGAISAEELKRFQDHLLSLHQSDAQENSDSNSILNTSINVRSNDSNREICKPKEDQKREELIEIQIKNRLNLKIRSNHADFCFNIIDESQAQDLIKETSLIITKYYPEKFPSDCINAAHALEKFYNYVKTCERDSDCAYISDDFLPVSSNDFEAFIADDCSFVKPLLVANHFGAVSNQLELLMRRELAREVCIKESKRASCHQPKYLKSKSINPVCVKGICKVHPLVKKSSGYF